MSWDPGLAYFFKTCPLCDVTSRKPPTETKSFFSILTTRLAESVEGLNSSLTSIASYRIATFYKTSGARGT